MKIINISNGWVSIGTGNKDGGKMIFMDLAAGETAETVDERLIKQAQQHPQHLQVTAS